MASEQEMLQRLVSSKSQSRPLVLVETPFAGRGKSQETQRMDHEQNIAYAKAVLHHSLSSNEAPMASHLLYPMVLDDRQPDQRLWGMTAGWAFLRVVDYVAVYTDRGISFGMEQGMALAGVLGKKVHQRSLKIPGQRAIEIGGVKYDSSTLFDTSYL